MGYKDKGAMLNYNEAIQLIENEFARLNKDIIEAKLEDSTGLTLAEDIYSDVNLPGFDNASMDGYAINYTQDKNSWNVTGEISAGNFKNYSIEINSAVRIMTGGRIPADANVVIPIEDVVEDGSRIKLREDVKIKLHQNIRYKGDDLKSDLIAINRNTILKAQTIALAAACGRAKLKVYRKLTMGVLATGDELVDIDAGPGEDKVRATNLYSLLAGIKEINMNPINFGVVKDDKDLLLKSVTSALDSDSDILITSGGVSVGKYDYLKDVFKETGVETIFWRVNIKPGKPLFFGKYDKGGKTKLVFGLPGNPVSSLVSFTLFIKPIVLKFYGHEEFNYQMAKLETPIMKGESKRYFVRGRLRYESKLNKFFVSVPGSQSSGNLAGLSYANCLIVIPEEKINPEAGEDVECIMI
jgi:molybdopterin molybdotransferase